MFKVLGVLSEASGLSLVKLLGPTGSLGFLGSIMEFYMMSYF